MNCLDSNVQQDMNSKALFVLCLLIVTVYGGSLLSGRGFQTSTSIKRSLITETITFTDQNEDNNVPIEGNGKNGGNSNVVEFLKWKLKVLS